MCVPDIGYNISRIICEMKCSIFLCIRICQVGWRLEDRGDLETVLNDGLIVDDTEGTFFRFEFVGVFSNASSNI